MRGCDAHPAFWIRSIRETCCEELRLHERHSKSKRHVKAA